MNILITGHKGMLGSELLLALQAAHAVYGYDLPDHNLLDVAMLTEYVTKNEIQFIYNCAAYTNVDACETNYDAAYAVNVTAVTNLAQVAKQCAVPLVHISTDYVFRGDGTMPYVPETKTEPLSAYGRTKALGEASLLSIYPENSYIVRTAWLYGINGKNFVETIITLAGQKPQLKVVNDQHGAPTYVGDLVQALLEFLKQPQVGIYHFTNNGETTWYGFAKEFFTGLKITTELLPCTTDEFPRPARRPAYSVLDLKKTEQMLGYTIPSWQSGLARYLNQRKLVKIKE